MVDSDKIHRPKPPTAKWGAACAACATAKAKCIRSNPVAGSKCDRCQRLFKECADQVHRPRKKRQVKPSRTAQLEDRLNGLVNLLKASGDLSKADLTPEALGIPVRLDRRSSSVGAGTSPSLEASPAPYQRGTGPWAIPETYNAGAPASCLCRPDMGDAPPPPDSDEILLNVYRSELIGLHPFVVIPSTMTAAHLQATRPFLMSAIRMVASFRSLKSMRAQMYQLMDHISDHALIRSERSLDLLLGLVVIIGWYQYHCFMHAQLNNLIGLATALVADLELTRTPKQDKTSILGINDPSVRTRTNEEKRALLGVWFLSSSMSLGFMRIQPLRYTRYMEKCVRELEESAEYESDIDLVNYVRIQHLTDRVAQINSQDKDTEEVPTFPSTVAPRSAYVAAYQAELDTIRESLPPRLKLDKIMQTYVNTVALRLYEPPEATTSFISSLTESLNSDYTVSAWPLEEMYRTHTAITNWFDTWMSVPVSQYYRQTTATCSLIVYAVGMLGRWARLVTPSMIADSPASFPDDPSFDGTDAGSLADVGVPTMPTLNSAVATPSNGSDSSTEKGPCAYNADRYRDIVDPQLPSALVSLQMQLQGAPGLAIDIPNLLSTIYTRFLQASASIQRRSVDGETREPNAWTVSALKIIVTRARLEEWADLISIGTSRLTLDDPIDDGVGGNQHMGDAGMPPGIPNSGPGLEAFSTGVPAQSIAGYSSETPWMSDLMQSGDPVVWFDRYMDWGMPPIAPQMGNMDQ